MWLVDDPVEMISTSAITGYREAPVADVDLDEPAHCRSMQSPSSRALTAAGQSRNSEASVGAQLLALPPSPISTPFVGDGNLANLAVSEPPSGAVEIVDVPSN